MGAADVQALGNAIHLYTTTLSPGEIAERTGINRGDLIRALLVRPIAPYDDPAVDVEAFPHDLDARLARRVAQ